MQNIYLLDQTMFTSCS